MAEHHLVRGPSGCTLRDLLTVTHPGRCRDARIRTLWADTGGVECGWWAESKGDSMAIDVGEAMLGTHRRSVLDRLNTEWHRPALSLLAATVLVHWAEHIAQAIQIWALGYEKPAARGVLGSQWPWLVSSEWLHYGFAVAMLAGLVLLLPGFRARARTFWILALGIQAWHFVEHQVLLVQALTGHHWFGARVPTSVLQQFWPMSRPELHLFYNAIVTIPMIVAMYFTLSPPLPERGGDVSHAS